MNAEAVRVELVRRKMRLLDLSRDTGIPYDRLVKILAGYRPARTAEIQRIAATLGLPESSVTGSD